jgi:hypothetical protein
VTEYDFFSIPYEYRIYLFSGFCTLAAGRRADRHRRRSGTRPFLGTVHLDALPYENVGPKRFYRYGDPVFPG